MSDTKSVNLGRVDRKSVEKGFYKLNFKQARRLQGPIYHVLLQEIYEECCPRTARYFKDLLAKEDTLIQLRVIRVRVRHNTDFLIKLVENFILAEQSFKLNQRGGVLAGAKIMYENVLLVEKYGKVYDWLAQEVYNIIDVNVMPDLENEKGFEEVQIRFYYKYGRFLYTMGTHLDCAIRFLDKSLELAKAESLAPDTQSERCYSTMGELVAEILAKTCLIHARKILPWDPQEALKLATKAVCSLAAVDSKDKQTLLESLLSKVLFMIESQMYDNALRMARKLQPYFTKLAAANSFRFQCELFLYKGICFYNLNDLSNALQSFETSYAISRKYQLTDLEGHIVLNIGRAHGKNPNEVDCALHFYRIARRIFAGLNDKRNKMKTIYLMAKLQADIFFSEFLRMIKSPNYCDHYNLMQWKIQCRPFWKGKSSVEQRLQRSTTASNASIFMRRKKSQKAATFKVPESVMSKASLMSKISFASKTSAIYTDEPSDQLNCLLYETWDDVHI